MTFLNNNNTEDGTLQHDRNTWNNVDESLTRCNQEDVEYSIASGRESLKMKTQ